jgi:hypothetical protein
MNSYRLHTLDVDEHNEINDEHSTDTTVELSAEPTVSEVCKALIAAERMAPDWPQTDVKVDESEWPDLYVTRKDGRKVYKLVPEEGEEIAPKCGKCGAIMTDTYCGSGQHYCEECDPPCPHH